MASHRIRSHLRDPYNPPAGLSEKAKKNWICNAKKQLQNYEYERDYPPFYISNEYYEIYYIHKFTKLNVIDSIIAHFRTCNKFTIDTETFRQPSNLALIQIQSVPTHLPSYVLLVQLGYLPAYSSILFKKIQLLFEILLDASNIIYSWGSLGKELQFAKKYSLFSSPIQATPVNMQSKFSEWFIRVPPYCEVCKPDTNTYIAAGSSLFCECRNHSYINSSSSWSLQNAVLYATNCFLDKSQTENDWFIMLDPKYSQLSSTDRNKMIHYAVYDCLSVTYLVLPVLNKWSLEKLQKTSINILLTDSEHVISEPDIENVSDDELPIVGRPLLLNNEHQQINNEVEISELEVDYASSSNQNLLITTNTFRRRSFRSSGARAERNRKRNTLHRLRRYRYCLVRSIYYRFTMKMVREILKKYKIRFTHVKPDGKHVLIGIKNEELKNKYQRLLPIDVFDRDHYFHL